MRLDKKIEKIGEFWLPDNLEVKFFGNLLIDENGHTSLKLLGNLHNIRPLENFDEIFDIEGKIEDFNYIKLVDCLYTHLNFNANNLCRAAGQSHYKDLPNNNCSRKDLFCEARILQRLTESFSSPLARIKFNAVLVSNALFAFSLRSRLF